MSALTSNRRSQAALSAYWTLLRVKRFIVQLRACLCQLRRAQADTNSQNHRIVSGAPGFARDDASNCALTPSHPRRPLVTETGESVLRSERHVAERPIVDLPVLPLTAKFRT